MSQGRHTREDEPMETGKSLSGKKRTRKDPGPSSPSPPLKRNAQEKEAEAEKHKEKMSKGKKDPFQEVIDQLKMKDYLKSPLTVQDILAIDSESFKDSELLEVEDIPQHFLRKLVALNVTARSTQLVPHSVSPGASKETEDQGASGTFFNLNKQNTRDSINPLDVLCVLLRCSDSFLQQDILQKMSMCQFSLPLLLPPCRGTSCTFMLWAMRDIVIKWRPHSWKDSKGFREESLVLTPMCTISFVRLGRCSLSKSKILNEVLSPPQQHHDFFIHQEMKSGNTPRRISDGLVESSWYFPGSGENSNLFPEPIAVANLRGDAEYHRLQFEFLTMVSSAVFIFSDIINESTYTLLLELNKIKKTKWYFICKDRPSEETLGFLNKLYPKLNLDNFRLLLKTKEINETVFAENLRSVMSAILADLPDKVTLEGMADTARNLGVLVDEDLEKCQSARELAEEITAEITNVEEYKKTTMKLQGDQWKKIAKVDKEIFRMKNPGDTPPETYRSKLRSELVELRSHYQEYKPPDAMNRFIKGIELKSREEKHYFLKWMKYYLDSHVRRTLSKLQGNYRETGSDSEDKTILLRELDNAISVSSLGVEHFMRELGQIYEATYSRVSNGKMRKRRKLPYSNLPGLAADLLLEGFPLELIDGDASNIPLQWVTDVLTELNTKLEGRSKMRVITVLGVQSTGKSTLLNTMFGLQFAVSSGRCTRGAFMLLMKAKESLTKELGCDFILVIDTEGLKAPELATLGDSYEHDNELATLVIGLSDITIVTMAMENSTEIKDILQIVVHAFLRMKEIGKKPNCQFVHQNVSDVSAHGKNRRDRIHFLEQLNKVTKAAARMEKHNGELKFSDIMEYDPDKHSWYIPGLWHGDPPMARVNTGYSQNVHTLKEYLFEFLKDASKVWASQNIISFSDWVNNLWNAVKRENFIFSFRNSLVADTYNQLCMKYNEWEWHFRKRIHSWVADTENEIQNQPHDQCNDFALEQLKVKALQVLEHEEQKMLACLNDYLESGLTNLQLIEKYREDFIISARHLKQELQKHAQNKCEEAYRINKNKQKIQDILSKCLKTAERKALSLLDECGKRKRNLGNEELEREFETMWRETLSELPLNHLETRKVDQEMHSHLIKALEKQGRSASQEVQKEKKLLDYGKTAFTIIKNRYFSFSCPENLNPHIIRKTSGDLGKLSRILICKCNSYVEEKVASNVDYDKTYCSELLHMINDRLKEEDVQRLHTTHSFEVELKLHILGKAADKFQTMHDRFIHENDPQICLEKLKPQYLAQFKGLFFKIDGSQQRAKDFCEQCLKPALTVYVNKRLGPEILDDIQRSQQGIVHNSPTFFQYKLLKDLLEANIFESYDEYLNNYEDFVKKSISRYIQNDYTRSADLDILEKKILSGLTDKIRNVIDKSKGENTGALPSFIEKICNMLKSDIVLRRDTLDIFLLQNRVNVQQFSADVQSFLPELEENILTQFKALSTETKLSNIPFNLQAELFRKVYGCGKQCPFCHAPCEAGGQEHRQHSASIHRPQGLGLCISAETNKLQHSLCSSLVTSNAACFGSAETKWELVPYKDYRRYYPDWIIEPDPSIDASDYWKYVLKEINNQFAEKYNALPAEYPPDWENITQEDALESIKKAFNMKERAETNANE